MTPEQREEALPSLPEPDVYLIVKEDGSYTESRGDNGTPYFDADQMAAYAAAAIAAQQAQAEPLSDDHIAKAWKAWPRQAITSAARAIEFVRALGVDAPRAPAVRAPPTEREAAYLAQEAGLRITSREETAALMRLVRFVEAAVSGGITQEHRR